MNGPRTIETIEAEIAEEAYNESHALGDIAYLIGERDRWHAELSEQIGENKEQSAMYSRLVSERDALKAKMAVAEIAEELAHLVEFECCTCEKGGSGDCSFEIEADRLSRAYMEAKYPHLGQREWPRKPVKAKPLDSAGLAEMLKDFKLERPERHNFARLIPVEIGEPGDESVGPTPKFGLLLGVPEPKRSEMLRYMFHQPRCQQLFEGDAGKQCSLADGHDGEHECEHRQSYKWRG